MSNLYRRVILDEKHCHFIDNVNYADELARLKMELAALENPLLVGEVALELQMERLRTEEAMKARDSALDRLYDAYVSIRKKNEIIERMQEDRKTTAVAPFPTQPVLVNEKETLEIDRLKAHIVTLEATIEELRSSSPKAADPPPCYEENVEKKTLVDGEAQTTDSPPVNNALQIVSGQTKYVPPQTEDLKELVNARNSILAEIPLPDNPPDATLTAIVFPPPVTLHEFLNMAPAPLKNALAAYRILQNTTTTWCPDREEHGFMYVPAFKCSTNPKIATAHRWSAVDPIGRMSKPTECFYHKDGIWYYAGCYKAFQMDTLSSKEWNQLPSETTSAIVKETIAARKNSSPQNTYETSQLYHSGALKVVSIGLQCVGFNQDIYKAILEHSAKLTENKWKSLIVSAPGTPTSVTAAGSTGSTTPVGIAKASKTPGMPRSVQRAGSAVSASSESPLSSQGPPAVSQLPEPPLSVTAKLSMIPLGSGSATPSIWATNSINSIGSSITGSGGVARLVASGSPLSAMSKIFESGRNVVASPGDVVNRGLT